MGRIRTRVPTASLAHGSRIIGVEVKAGKSRRLSRSQMSFIEAYNPEAFVLVLGEVDDHAPENVDKTKVYRVSIEAMSALLRELLTD